MLFSERFSQSEFLYSKMISCPYLSWMASVFVNEVFSKMDVAKYFLEVTSTGYAIVYSRSLIRGGLPHTPVGLMSKRLRRKGGKCQIEKI